VRCVVRRDSIACQDQREVVGLDCSIGSRFVSRDRRWVGGFAGVDGPRRGDQHVVGNRHRAVDRVQDIVVGEMEAVRPAHATANVEKVGRIATARGARAS
jgi:hypothetical protein